MTVVPSSGTDVAPWSDDDMVGLEDIGVSDVVIPRLQIQHADGVFMDNLSKATYSELDVILLGLVKQRIFWHDEVDDGDKPLCKSPDHEHGFPNVSEDTPKDKRFPWSKSNFNPADFPASDGMNGLVTLPCSSCVFKEWDKGDWKVPPCAEQHTYPLLYTPDEGETWTPALLTLQKTGIKPSRQYISSFAQSKTPMFTVRTKLSLTLQSRGSVRYSVPVFRRGEATDRAYWREYGDQLRSIRDFIRQPPRRQDEDDEAAVTPSDNTNTAPATATASPTPTKAEQPAAPAAPATPAPQPEPAADDDDLPF